MKLFSLWFVNTISTEGDVSVVSFNKFTPIE